MSEVITNEIEFTEDDQETSEFDELMEQLMRISVNKDNLADVEFDKANFKKGLKDISHICGMLTGLMNVGISALDALAYVMNEHVMDNNIELNKLVNEAEIAKSKFQQLQIEKQTV